MKDGLSNFLAGSSEEGDVVVVVVTKHKKDFGIDTFYQSSFEKSIICANDTLPVTIVVV
jgi:hypothetical protein